MTDFEDWANARAAVAAMRDLLMKAELAGKDAVVVAAQEHFRTLCVHLDEFVNGCFDEAFDEEADEDVA